MSLPTIRLDTLLTGRVQPFTRPGTQSAIDKQPQQGQLKVSTLGLHGDEQGDLRVHGGVEKPFTTTRSSTTPVGPTNWALIPC